MINFLLVILILIFISIVFKVGRFFGKIEKQMNGGIKNNSSEINKNFRTQKKNKPQIEEADFEEIE